MGKIREQETVLDLEEDLSSEELADWIAETSQAEVVAVCVWLSNHGEDRIPTSGKTETLLYAISKCDPELVKDAIRTIFIDFDDIEDDEEPHEEVEVKKSSSKAKRKNPVAYQAVVNCDKDGNIIEDDDDEFEDDQDDDAEA